MNRAFQENSYKSMLFIDNYLGQLVGVGHEQPAFGLAAKELALKPFDLPLEVGILL